MTTTTLQDVGFDREWMAASARAFWIAAGVVVALAVIVIFSTQPAWRLLGVGRGFVTPGLYPAMGLVVLLGTTFGQFAGWAAGSALFAYFGCLFLGSSSRTKILQVSMTLVYLGLAAVPLFAYHMLFGQPLAGIDRPELTEWLRQNSPAAYWLVFIIHPIVDWSLIPLGAGVLAILWGYFDGLRHDRQMQVVFLLLVLLTSFAVALSLAAHSTLVHIRLD